MHTISGGVPPLALGKTRHTGENRAVPRHVPGMHVPHVPSYYVPRAPVLVHVHILCDAMTILVTTDLLLCWACCC